MIYTQTALTIIIFLLIMILFNRKSKMPLPDSLSSFQAALDNLQSEADKTVAFVKSKDDSAVIAVIDAGTQKIKDITNQLSAVTPA